MTTTIDAISKDAQERMEKTLQALRQELVKVRTGRAHASLLDHVTVDYYGSELPITQCASVTVADPRTLAVAPWEKRMVPLIEKAILGSDLGLNPVTSGDVIRVPLPPLTEERRRDMTRVVRQEAENARIAVRNIRRDANHHLKALIKEESLAKDEEKRAEDMVQKLTDQYIAAIEQTLKEKEAELMEV